MMRRFWLRYNFLRRGLLWLRKQVGKQLFDARLVRNGRELRIGSSDPVSLESNYVEWIAQSTRLPSGDNSTAPLCFPVNEYLDSLKRSNALDADFFHHCRASRLNGGEPSVILIYNKRSGNTPH